MLPNKKRRVDVTERDIEILISLFKNKVLNLKQIQDSFFSGADKSTVCKRIRKLVHIGLVNTKFYQQNSRSKAAYGISNKGVEFLKHDLPYEVTSRYYVSDSILHDLTLFDVANVFSGFSQVSKVYTESELSSMAEFASRQSFRSFIEMRSDRMLVIGEGARSSYVALEYERSRKSNDRVAKKFGEYYRHHSIEAVLYVCETASMAKFLMKKDSEIEPKTKSKIYFCSLDEVLSGSTSVIFRNHEGSTLKFT